DRIVHASIEYSSASIEKLGPEGVKVLKREIEAVKADLNELKGLKIGDRSKWPHVVGMVQVDAELRPISDSFLEEDFRVLLSRVVPVLGKHRVQVPRETTA